MAYKYWLFVGWGIMEKAMVEWCTVLRADFVEFTLHCSLSFNVFLVLGLST